MTKKWLYCIGRYNLILKHPCKVQQKWWTAIQFHWKMQKIASKKCYFILSHWNIKNNNPSMSANFEPLIPIRLTIFNYLFLCINVCFSVGVHPQCINGRESILLPCHSQSQFAPFTSDTLFSVRNYDESTPCTQSTQSAGVSGMSQRMSYSKANLLICVIRLHNMLPRIKKLVPVH